MYIYIYKCIFNNRQNSNMAPNIPWHAYSVQFLPLECRQNLGISWDIIFMIMLHYKQKGFCKYN